MDGSDSDSDGSAELAFPNIFKRLSQRAANGGRGRLSHLPVLVPGEALNHFVPAATTATVDRVLKAVWTDAWFCCAGEMLPFGLVVREVTMAAANIETVADMVKAFNQANLDAVPDVFGCGVFPNASAASLPMGVRRCVHALTEAIDPFSGRAAGSPGSGVLPPQSSVRDYGGRKSFVFFIHEHAAHVPLPHVGAATVPSGENGEEAALPSAKTLEKVSSRILSTVRAGAPLGLHGDFALGAIGLTRQRRKVLRHVLVADEPLRTNVMNLGLDELYADYDLLVEKDRIRREMAASAAASAERRGRPEQRSERSGGGSRTPTPPSRPLMRQVYSRQDLRGKPLFARLDWASDDDDSDSEPDPAAVQDFVMSRQQSRARLAANRNDHDAAPSGTHTPRQHVDPVATTPPTSSIPPAAGDENAPEPFIDATRHLSTISFGADGDDADEEFVPVFSRAADCTLRVQLACTECAKHVCSSGYHIAVTSCSGPGTHLVCADCLNHRVSDLIAHGFVDLDKLPCTRDDCFGDMFFDDFAGLLTPTVRRFWCRESMKAARDAVTRDVQQRLDEAAGIKPPTTAAMPEDTTEARLQREALL
eukprot:CAMPEP_0174847320 /NCGR_PEP_ID=MMETSP1114-20130205/12837_1 /TAXON_ID=312471 /ORGANISM="Neobodo designis, Strain CCAP 1951/1" /LENGTH=591 /DNA_ID=CAMNT_0016081593 /DNA_START=35 /DNA_END=1810 /DNA_ORIENTATION=-